MSRAWRLPKALRKVIQVSSRGGCSLDFASSFYQANIQAQAASLASPALGMEVQILQRLVYKNNSQHRSSLLMQKAREVLKIMALVHRLQLPDLLLDLHTMTQLSSSFAKSASGNNRGASGCRFTHCLPIREACVFTMARLIIGCSILQGVPQLIVSVHPLSCTGCSILQGVPQLIVSAARPLIAQVGSSYFMPLCMTLLGLLSRIQVLAMQMLLDCSKAYNALTTLLPLLPPSDASAWCSEQCGDAELLHITATSGLQAALNALADDTETGTCRTTIHHYSSSTSTEDNNVLIQPPPHESSPVEGVLLGRKRTAINEDLLMKETAFLAGITAATKHDQKMWWQWLPHMLVCKWVAVEQQTMNKHSDDTHPSTSPASHHQHLVMGTCSAAAASRSLLAPPRRNGLVGGKRNAARNWHQQQQWLRSQLGAAPINPALIIRSITCTDFPVAAGLLITPPQRLKVSVVPFPGNQSWQSLSNQLWEELGLMQGVEVMTVGTDDGCEVVDAPSAYINNKSSTLGREGSKLTSLLTSHAHRHQHQSQSTTTSSYKKGAAVTASTTLQQQQSAPQVSSSSLRITMDQKRNEEVPSLSMSQAAAARGDDQAYALHTVLQQQKRDSSRAADADAGADTSKAAGDSCSGRQTKRPILDMPYDELLVKPVLPVPMQSASLTAYHHYPSSASIDYDNINRQTNDKGVEESGQWDKANVILTSSDGTARTDNHQSQNAVQSLQTQGVGTARAPRDDSAAVAAVIIHGRTKAALGKPGTAAGGSGVASVASSSFFDMMGKSVASQQHHGVRTSSAQPSARLAVFEDRGSAGGGSIESSAWRIHRADGDPKGGKLLTGFKRKPDEDTALDGGGRAPSMGTDSGALSSGSGLLRLEELLGGLPPAGGISTRESKTVPSIFHSPVSSTSVVRLVSRTLKQQYDGSIEALVLLRVHDLLAESSTSRIGTSIHLIASCPNLTSLTLTLASTGLHMASVASALQRSGAVHTLRHLHIQSSQWKTLEQMSFLSDCVNLLSLEVHYHLPPYPPTCSQPGGGVASLGELLTALPRLTSFALCGCPLAPQAGPALAPALAALTALRQLSLNRQPLLSRPGGLSPVPQLLIQLTHLEELNLVGVCLASNSFLPDPRHMAPCVDILASCLKPLSKRLKRLDLSNNALTEFGIDKLLPALVGLSSLQYLLLSHNMIKGTEVPLRFMGILRQLRRLDLTGNLFEVDVCLDLAEKERPDLLVECA
ncbi:hypothetical protein CEUSTIGMA_g11669.t1 [Chlamydomonas eustigma]|uniref:Uncharacterized protein n=1 Tax=Chlamydomonas eustigma TaxID=1157962 RepID=A0A250XMK0_9CHLO|nr:hypothetical protein CEUSTIGMA_g11669.t1 [Chlamydomonas eustigma]|eukprot:GAX84246.1 hypothetical protein CEUSTIGMA_g11669.t1 [Chlamydomonas eustigma]